MLPIFVVFVLRWGVPVGLCVSVIGNITKGGVAYVVCTSVSELCYFLCVVSGHTYNVRHAGQSARSICLVFESDINSQNIVAKTL